MLDKREWDAPLGRRQRRSRVADDLQDLLEVLERPDELEVLVVARVVGEGAVLRRPVRRPEGLGGRRLGLQG